MTSEESEKIYRNMEIIHPSLEDLKSFDAGIYDEDSNLIGNKEGDNY